MQQAYEIEQTLGKVLGYPWYKDDLKNFPEATEADGVCVGEHVPETLAREAAVELERLRGEVDKWRKECEGISEEFGLPPTIRPAEGEITRLLGYAKEVDTLRATVATQAARITALERAAQDALHTLRYGADGSEPEWVRGSIALLEQALFAPTPPAPVFAPGVTGRQMPPGVAPSSPG